MTHQQITVTADETYKLVVGKSCDFNPVHNYLSFVIWSCLHLLAVNAASATDSMRRPAFRWADTHKQP